MNLIDRYVYAVIKNLPQKQQSDIEREIRSLIDDMLEQYPDNEPEETKVHKVLLDLGAPELLADSYRENKRYLVGPENFDNYLIVLKIVMGAVFLGISVATLTGVFFTTEEDIISMVVNYIATLFSGMLQGFAWVTGIFGIAEYKGIKLVDKKEAWSPAKLPTVPQKSAMIPKVDTVLAILLTTVFMSILIFAPQVIAAYIRDAAGRMTTIPVFNLEILKAYKIILMIIFAIAIIKEVMKLMAGRWSLKLGLSIAALNIVEAVLALLIFTNSRIWNADFTIEVFKYANIDAVALPWINFPIGVVMVIVLVHGIDTAISLYKGWKYN